MNRVLILFMALLLVPLAPLAATPGADAQGGSFSASAAPWWGPGDQADRQDGWHFRFPVVVENPHSYPLEDAVALVEADIGALLIEAGWNSRTLGASSFPTSFELDPTSIRVIEYKAGFADIASNEPLQSRFYPGSFSASAQATYDPARNPVGTIAVLVDETLPPGASRSFMVYFTSTQQGEREDVSKPSPVDGWAGSAWGTRSYGHQATLSGGSVARTDVVARLDNTQVTVFEYKGGRPALADLPNNPNPMTLSAGQAASLALPGNTFFKVEADKPVLVASRGGFQDTSGTYGGGAFIPAVGSSFAGDRFLFPSYAPEIVVSTSKLGTARVTASTTQGDNLGTLDLSTARPTGTLSMPVSPSPSNVNVIELQVQGVPVTVQYGGSPAGSHTVPARTGGPAGTDHLTLAPPGSLMRLYPEDPAEVRVLDALRPDRQLFPFGKVETTEAAELTPYPPATRVAANDSFPQRTPARVLSVAQEGVATPVHVTAGSGGHAGPFLPDGELTTFVRDRTAIMGAFNGTRVTITENIGGQSKARTETVNKDGVILFEPDKASITGEATISLTKPATVVPVEPRDNYARPYPAFGGSLEAKVGELDFRGALVGLRMEGAVGGQTVRTIGPGQSTSLKVEVTNRGHWLRDAPITEEVKITCSDPGPSWTVRGCGETFTLATGQTRRATLEIQPGDVQPGSRLLLKVAAEGQRWNTTDQGQMALLVREAFGVEAWFFAQGGPKDLRDSPFFVDRGDTTTVPFVIENTGTVEDSYELRLFPPSDGWQVTALDDGEPVTTITLDPGDRANLAFEAVAAADPPQLRTLLDLDVVSLSNELAAAKLVGAFEILTVLDVSISTPSPVALLDPGETKDFPIVLRNDGESVVNIALDPSPAVPEGWNVTVPVPEIAIQPEEEVQLNVRLEVPTGAPAGQRGTISLNAEASRSPGDTPTVTRLDLTGLVRHVHDIGFPTEAITLPAGPGAALNVPLVNNGNGQEDVAILGLSPSWAFRTSGPLTLPPGETGVLSLELDVPPQTPAGPHNLTIHTSLSRQAQRNITLPLVIEETPRLAVTLSEVKPLMPGKPVTMNARISADGNVPLSGSLDILLPETWSTQVTPATINLDPGEQAPATITLTGPEDLPDGTVEVGFALDPGQGERITAEPRTLQAGRPDLSLSAVEVEELPGGGLLVRANVANGGTVDARGVDLALLRDGARLASASVERIAVGQSVPVSLATERTGNPQGVTLVADPAHRLADPDRSDNTVALSGDGIPAPPVAALLLALAALALLMGRRGRRWRP